MNNGSKCVKLKGTTSRENRGANLSHLGLGKAVIIRGCWVKGNFL